MQQYYFKLATDIITDADALETEILESEEVTSNVVEKITLMKAVLARTKPLKV